MSKAVRAAMVKASVENIEACANLDEYSGLWLTAAPLADVRNVLAELERLQVLESRIRDWIGVKEQLRSEARKNERIERDQWEIEEALAWQRRSMILLDEIDNLKGLLDNA